VTLIFIWFAFKKRVSVVFGCKGNLLSAYVGELENIREVFLILLSWIHFFSEGIETVKTLWTEYVEYKDEDGEKFWYSAD
jgi:hypothetical protein